MSSRPAIVVLTPLKNDAWILRHFLQVASIFADAVIVADQGSTDAGRDICRSFAKVEVIDNSGGEYDEASRQRLLIDAARDRIPLPRILMALDADEILAADAMASSDWQALLNARPGTTVCFEKPNLYLTPWRCERRPSDFPGAFVDDGCTVHRPQRIHSPRLPLGSERLVLDGVKFLHCALLRPEAQRAKMRMYAALENVMGTKSLYWRRRYYSSRQVLRPMGPVEPTPREWLSGWADHGIDVTDVKDEEPYWQDFATLDLLLAHGSRRFWFDDVWGKDWSRFAQLQGRPARIEAPPRALSGLMNVAQALLESAGSARRALSRARAAEGDR